MAKLFFLLSGENRTLPAAELAAILEAEGYVFEIKEKLDQTMRIETELKCIRDIHDRSAYTRICASEMFICQAKLSSIIAALDSIELEGLLGKKESFCVRIRRVKTYSKDISTMTLEGMLGEKILRKTNKTRVNLTTPNITFFGILTSGKLVFGVKLAEILPKPFVERRPIKKPFFHPSAMPSKLARCMVNLAHSKSGELILDPFCGTGSVIIEAALINCLVLGLDVQKRMAKGCMENLNYFGRNVEGLVIADARKLPINRVDHVVTDPPYGRCSTTMKSTTRRLIEGLLISAHGLLDKDQRICIASPKKLNIKQIGAELGYQHVESHFAYIHRSLTREIAVFKKV